MANQSPLLPGGVGGGHKEEEEGAGRSQGRRPPFCILSKEEGRLLYSRIHFECYPIGCFHWAGHYPVSGTMKKHTIPTNGNFICVKNSIFYFIIHFLKLSPRFVLIFLLSLPLVLVGRGPLLLTSYHLRFFVKSHYYVKKISFRFRCRQQFCQGIDRGCRLGRVRCIGILSRE